MDSIRLFISDILLQVLISNNFQFFDKRKLSLCRNFYDIDEYITWAEKYLSRIVSKHLKDFFRDDIPFDDYIQISADLRTNPAVIHDIRQQLNRVFPFIQRIYYPEKVVFSYIDMLETLYDTLKIEKESFVIPAREKKLVELSPEGKPATDEDEPPSITVEQEAKSSDEEDQGNEPEPDVPADSEPVSEDKDNEPELDVSLVADTEPVSIPIEQDTSEPDEDNLSEEKIEPTIETVEPETTTNVAPSKKRVYTSRITDEQRRLKETCGELGIIYKSKQDSSQLIKDYEAGTIDPARLNMKGLKRMVKKYCPTTTYSNKSREKLTEILLEALKTTNP